MGTYAKDTSVSTERSKAEIERTLVRYGADQFAYGTTIDRAIIGFRAHDRQIRMELVLPKLDDFRYTPAKRIQRTDREAEKAWEQGCRQAWRALSLIVKAKLEAVESDIATFEDEFMAYIVLPGGQTVSQAMSPAIAEAYETGAVQPFVLALPGS